MFFPLFSAKKEEIPFMLDELIRLSLLFFLEIGKTRSNDPNYLHHRQQSVLSKANNVNWKVLRSTISFGLNGCYRTLHHKRASNIKKDLFTILGSS